MSIFARIFAATPEELELMAKDTRAYLEKNSREIELELLKRRQIQQLTIDTLRKDSGSK
jgi:hypothetical protein